LAPKIPLMRTPFTSSKWWVPAALSGTFFFFSCSHKLAPEGHFQSTPIVTDGKTDDWPIPLRFSNGSRTLQYNVTNDDNNIYICISSKEAATQLRILRSGMTIWLDPKGEKNKTMALYFPIGKQPDPERYSGRNSKSTGSDVNTREAELLLQSNYYNTIGFLDMENGQFGVTDTKSPIQLAIKHNDQDSVLVYEVMIPVRNVLGADWEARANKKSFSVGIVLNGTPGTPAGGGGLGPRTSPGGMRGMGGMRSGMGSGRGYGGGGPVSRGQKEDADWYTFRLAVKK
jgi:hypothetical protein